MSASIEPFHLYVEQEALDDLARRLAATRWPERETVGDWSQGVPLEQVQALCRYWQHSYDWRRCEAWLNGIGQYKTDLDGLSIHFLHKRSPEPNAMPLLITHGWPGSVIEFHKIIGPLTDPVAYGGRSEDAFHVVAPSLPGYGFSGKPSEAGWSVPRIAHAWCELMQRLGYQRFVAQGGDWGSAITTIIARLGLPEVLGVHLNMVIALPEPDEAEPVDERERAILAREKRFRSQGYGYARLQATRPQTIGYGLVDSPVGQAAWIYEKFYEWTDCAGDPLNVLTFDELLDNIMLYWLPGTGASSARLYWESLRGFPAEPIDIPIACSIFPKDIYTTSRRWAERKYRNIIHWNELDKGGHFAAFEQPELFVDELRQAFRSLR
jgi:pimeloyl-ACP methyl ester carboxylesterase